MLKFMLKARAKQIKKNQKGFTLVELIVVMAIVAILAALAIGRFGGFTTQAKTTADYASAATIASAANSLKAANPTIDDADLQPDKLVAADLIDENGQRSKSITGNPVFVVTTVTSSTNTNVKDIEVTAGNITFYPNPNQVTPETAKK